MPLEIPGIRGNVRGPFEGEACNFVCAREAAEAQKREKEFQKELKGETNE